MGRSFLKQNSSNIKINQPCFKVSYLAAPSPRSLQGAEKGETLGTKLESNASYITMNSAVEYKHRFLEAACLTELID